MSDLDASRRSIRSAEAGGPDPFLACRFVVPAVLLSACIAAGASAMLAESSGAHHVRIYTDLSTLIEGHRAMARCASSRTGGAAATASCPLVAGSADERDGL